MRIKRATLYVYDPDAMRSREADELLAGKRWVEGEDRKVPFTIEVRSLHADPTRPSHDVRVYADYEAAGCEGPMLIDWFEVWAGEVTLWGGFMSLTGFGRAPKVRNWTEDSGYSYDGDEGSPFQRVEWRFSDRSPR